MVTVETDKNLKHIPELQAAFVTEKKIHLRSHDMGILLLHSISEIK